MAVLSDFAREKIAEALLGNQAPAIPATFYIALCTAAPTAASTGSTISEPSGNGYARVSITNNQTNWGQLTAGIISNALDFTGFAASGGNWAQTTHWALCSAATLGDMWLFGALGVAKTVLDGDSAQFDAGDIDIDFTGL